MSVHTDDVDVSVTFVISFVTMIFDEDECFELIEEDVDVLVPC